MSGRNPASAGSGSATSSFDALFRAAARRVLERHGVPPDRIDAEIERLRKIEPAFSGPSLDEFLTPSPAGGDKR